MSDQPIPAEAIEAAKQALIEHYDIPDSQLARYDLERNVRAALEAAAPALRAQGAAGAAAELENLRHALKEAGKEMDRRYQMGAAAERERQDRERPVFVVAVSHKLGEDDAARIQRAVAEALTGQRDKLGSRLTALQHLAEDMLGRFNATGNGQQQASVDDGQITRWCEIITGEPDGS